jgi:hypothetical protein
LIALTILVLSTIYTAVIAGMVLALRWMRIPAPYAIVLGFLIFGALSGLLTAWVWPIESSIYCNVYAALLGDKVYIAAIEYLGNSHSANAHETIPWILRIPQVYVLASVMLSGGAGLFVQWLYTTRRLKQVEGQ